MNALSLSMKLESQDLNLGTSERCTESSGKKCKNNRKKTNPVNSVDKGLQQTGNGLRCESIPLKPLDSKDCWTFEPINSKKKRTKKSDDHGRMVTKTEKLQERLQMSLSEETKKKILAILAIKNLKRIFGGVSLLTEMNDSNVNDIRLLSDIEKLFLYLQLPTGASVDEDPLKQKCIGNPLGKKAEEEGTIAVTWIQSHLEEDPEVSLPKQEVYDEYQSYCEVTGNESLCAADFGKVMKQIFPSVKPRRLGTRGNSRYCYSGLRKKLTVSPPALPDLQVEKENSKKSDQENTDEAMLAACHVLLEWAEKLLETKFCSVKDVASYLIENMYVDNRSVAAFTLLLSSSPEQLEKVSTSGNIKCENKNKRSETQIHLQRKIQEKELIKEQKRKLQVQRSSLSTLQPEKPTPSKKKGLKNRKPKLMNGQMSKNKGNAPRSKTKQEIKDDMSSDSLPKKSDSNDTCKCQPLQFTCQGQNGGSQCAEVPTEQSTQVVDELCDNVLVIDESPKAKTKSSISVPSDKTPVCISQSLPGFIFVPSISQVHLTDVGKPCNKTPKYKRIQPKPLNELTVPSSMRCRAGSLGSIMFKENRSRTDGRRSSLALLQSDSKQEFLEDHVSQRIKNVNSVSSSLKIKTIKSETNIAENSCQKNMNVKSSKACNQKNDSSIESPCNSPSPTGSANEIQCSDHRNTNKRSQKNNTSPTMDEISAIKRHFEDDDIEVASKKPHLEDLMSSDVSSESLSPWAKDISSINCSINSNFIQNASNEERAMLSGQDEVSIHELESDALIDYLHGTGVDSNSLINDADRFSEVQSSLLVNTHSKGLEENDFLNTEVKKQLLNPEMTQLSQLRILLQQNLPPNAIKPIRAASVMNYSSKKSSVLMHTNDLSLPQQVELINKNKKEMLNNDISAVFLRNNNPYLSGESDIASSGTLTSSQLNSESLLSNSSDMSSQGLITEQDLLTVMGEQIPLSKSNLQLISSNKILSDIGESSGNFSFSSDMSCNNVNVEHSSAQTQIPSVPPSPNTRRRAFNFMPISPRHTPIPDALCNAPAVSCYSPVLGQQSRNTVSVSVGPSQPPSNAGSPFVSPRSTPVPPSRSRHSSGQSSYSTSRHTPFQNFDSGVSSISSSPFISPQPTPVPVSRLRHNSSHGPSKTVTFSTTNNNNNQVIHSLSSVIGHGPLRLRHSSGPGGPPGGFSLSPRSAPLSPLVNENGLSTFNFPPVSETRSRHNSGLTTAPLSPVSEQVPASIGSNQSQEIPVNFENSLISSDPFINDNSGKTMIGVNTSFRLTRQRHASSSVIYSRASMTLDPLAHEVQHFLKNGSENPISRVDTNIRSRSVPLHQMLRNFASNSASYSSSEDLKTYATISNKHGANIPMLVSNASATSMPITSDSLILRCDKSLLQPLQNDWASLDSTSDMEMSVAQKNSVDLLEVPLRDDLQTTLEDLRDCDTDFSKFAQELEQELSHNNDNDI